VELTLVTPHIISAIVAAPVVALILHTGIAIGKNIWLKAQKKKSYFVQELAVVWLFWVSLSVSFFWFFTHRFYRLRIDNVKKEVVLYTFPFYERHEPMAHVLLLEVIKPPRNFLHIRRGWNIDITLSDGEKLRSLKARRRTFNDWKYERVTGQELLSAPTP
jgi:hypothetical protein